MSWVARVGGPITNNSHDATAKPIGEGPQPGRRCRAIGVAAMIGHLRQHHPRVLLDPVVRSKDALDARIEAEEWC